MVMFILAARPYDNSTRAVRKPMAPCPFLMLADPLHAQGGGDGLWDKPVRLVLPLIRPGFQILEVGLGSGFFTFPMAQSVGGDGRLFCVELQEKVRRRLSNAVSRRAMDARIEVRPCIASDLQVQDLAGSLDLAVAIDVLHEIGDPASTIQQMTSTLRPGGRLLIREPGRYCPEAVFKAGLVRLPNPQGLGSRAQVALFQKP